MSDVRETELGALGLAVATETFGPGVVAAVAGEAYSDHAGEPSCFFTIGLEPASDRPFTAPDMVKLGLALSAALGRRGDDRFPYVNVQTLDEWRSRFGG